MTVLLPSTLFIGATFPFAVRILATGEADAAPASARVYAWNTFGAIVGAAVAGFVLIPLLKYEGAIQMAVAVNAALALAASLLVFRRRHRTAAAAARGSARHRACCTGLIMPEEILRTSPMTDYGQGEIRFYEVGRSATVLDAGGGRLSESDAPTACRKPPPICSAPRPTSTTSTCCPRCRCWPGPTPATC